MKFITYQQYIDYLKSKNIVQLQDRDEIYKIQSLTKEKIYQETEINKVNKIHDKMFRRVLSRKKEVVKFLNQFLNLKEKIEETQIIPYPTDFISRQYKNRQSDIIYKLKNKPIYFLIEHQSSVDYDMPIRLWEYIGEIMRKETISQKTYLRKEKIYPIVVPIVIYTGLRKWNISTNFMNRQYNSPIYKKYLINLEYNLIDIYNYSFEELLNKGTLFSSIMIIEKCKTSNELLKYLNEIIKVINDLEEREILSEFISQILILRNSNIKAKKILDKIYEKTNY